MLDEHGQKMSKSKGNGIDPLEVIDQYGADALRFAMTHTSTGGQDIRWDARRVEMGRNFNNKLWNAARFAMMNLNDAVEETLQPETLADRWMLSRLQRAVGEMTAELKRFDLGAANRAAYDFVWSEFCDWYLEAAKPHLREGDARTRGVLKHTLTTILKLLHPMIPFVTAELYEALGFEEDLGRAAWPEVDEKLIDEAAERDFTHLQDAVTAARNLRSEANLSPAQMITVHVEGPAAGVIDHNAETFAALARAHLHTGALEGASLSQLVPGLTLRLPLAGLVDIDEWRARQEKRLAELQKDRTKSQKKLANPKFMDNAPREVVEEERRRLAEAEALIGGLEASLSQLA